MSFQSASDFWSKYEAPSQGRGKSNGSYVAGNHKSKMDPNRFEHDEILRWSLPKARPGVLNGPQKLGTVLPARVNNESRLTEPAAPNSVHVLNRPVSVDAVLRKTHDSLLRVQKA